jgi:hydroxyacylglutathione hydrolase
MPPSMTLTRSTPSAALTPLSASVDVHTVPVLGTDNFAYLIHDKTSNVCAVVDAVRPRALLALAASLGARVSTCLTTHHHRDHSGGNVEISVLVPGICVIGSKYEDAPAVTVRMADQEKRVLAGGTLVFSALHTPCHTNGHLCFVLETETPAVFCGDTLFVGGCGRFFEGDAADMHRSLNTVLAGLPGNCKVFCGHEYTVANLTFAQTIDPLNDALSAKLSWAKEQLAAGRHTVPSTIGEELAYNPFMRVAVPEVAAGVKMTGHSSEKVMDALRSAKNSF